LFKLIKNALAFLSSKNPEKIFLSIKELDKAEVQRTKVLAHKSVLQIYCFNRSSLKIGDFMG